MKGEKEYLMLRDEMTWRQKGIDTLGTFTYTAFVSILGVALSTGIIEMFLLPLVVILPISLKVAYHKYAISLIVVYLNEFLEDINDTQCFKWEKSHAMYFELNPRGIKEKIFFYGSSIEYILMCIISSIFFWIKYLSQDKVIFTILQIGGFILVQAVVIFLVTYVTIGYTVLEKKKPSIIPNWVKVKDKFMSGE